MQYNHVIHKERDQAVTDIEIENFMLEYRGAIKTSVGKNDN